MMRNLSNFLFCCVIVLLIGAVCISPVAGAQFTVAPTGGGFTSIQAAVTWASPPGYDHGQERDLPGSGQNR